MNSRLFSPPVLRRLTPASTFNCATAVFATEHQRTLLSLRTDLVQLQARALALRRCSRPISHVNLLPHAAHSCQTTLHQRCAVRILSCGPALRQALPAPACASRTCLSPPPPLRAIERHNQGDVEALDHIAGIFSKAPPWQCLEICCKQGCRYSSVGMKKAPSCAWSSHEPLMLE